MLKEAVYDVDIHLPKPRRIGCYYRVLILQCVASLRHDGGRAGRRFDWRRRSSANRVVDGVRARRASLMPYCVFCRRRTGGRIN